MTYKLALYFNSKLTLFIWSSIAILLSKKFVKEFIYL